MSPPHADAQPLCSIKASVRSICYTLVWMEGHFMGSHMYVSISPGRETPTAVLTRAALFFFVCLRR